MRILVICQYYYPEPFRLNDYCEELVKRGHVVTVVTGEPNYPEGCIYKGYENHAHADELYNGVRVIRCPILPRKTGSLNRMLNYFSYPYQARKVVKNLEDYDIVLVNQLSPIMMAEPAICYKKKNNVPILLYCLDLWPESLIAGGVSKDSIIYRVFHYLSKRIYKKTDKILVTSQMFKSYFFKEFGIKESAIDYLPQYAEDIFEVLPYQEHEGLTNLVFAGNIGAIQNVETIIMAAKRLESEQVHFHIVGSGSNFDKLKKMSSGQENVTFYGRRPLEEMPKFYAMADAMLITLKADSILSFTLPGKVQSYMAAGKPIIGAIDGEAAQVIRLAKCGYCGKAEDVDELVNNIYRFIKTDKKKQMGINARSFYDENFSRKVFMDKIEHELFTLKKIKV